MRPIRIDLTKITKREFIKLIMGYFPNFVDKTSVKLLYEELINKYLQVIIDLDSGEVIHAFLPEGTWVLSKFYMDCVPTPDELDSEGYFTEDSIIDEYHRHYEQEYEEEIRESKPKKEVPEIDIETKIDNILDKISKNGIEALTIKEKKLLKKYSDKE